ncbi:hypothetical protein JTB14_037168 [Gonioctena quinquepunctata]|nr:hypothetical protein JTB14_037168 [Gonioctena quinquepunctata]
MLVCLSIFLSFVGITLSESSQCKKLSALAALEDHKTVVETSLRLLAGTWISEGCEVRPGPEYILRAYGFENDGKFLLIQHHYWDDSCSSPRLSITSHGRIQLRSSLIQPGAATGLIRVSNITIIPHDNDAAADLNNIVSSECPGKFWKSWRRYEEHSVYDSRFDEKKKTFNLWSSPYDHVNTHPTNSRKYEDYFSDMSCLGSLKWAFNELRLLKIQLRPVIEDKRRRLKFMTMELLLGDIHSNARLREYYNPTSFQSPLAKQVSDEIVSVNRHSYIIKNANPIPSNIFTNGKNPPHLIKKPNLPPYIWGEWTSARCEVRPMGVYLTRQFSFQSEDSKWVGEHRFYSDALCKLPKFTLSASGYSLLDGTNEKLKGVSNIDFHIERATLTVLDQSMIHDMRLQGVCGRDEWKVNIPKDLSPSSGCAPLGIIIPSIFQDIAKFDMDYMGSCLLFLGQIETDNLLTTSSERPTSFQPPLVRCGEVDSYSLSLKEILGQESYHNDAGKRNISWLWFYAIIKISCYIL